jgi:hypothetical protein
LSGLKVGKGDAVDDVVADRGVEVVVIMDVVVAARVLVVERVGVGMLEEVEVGGVQVVVEDCLVVVDGRSVDEVEAVP